MKTIWYILISILLIGCGQNKSEVYDRDTNVDGPITNSLTFEDVPNIITNLNTGSLVLVMATGIGKSSDVDGEVYMRISEGIEGKETDTSVGVFVKGTNEAGLSTMDVFKPTGKNTDFHVQFRTNGIGIGTLDQITLIVIELKDYKTIR